MPPHCTKAPKKKDLNYEKYCINGSKGLKMQGMTKQNF